MSRHVTEQAMEWLQTLRQPEPGQEEAFVDWVRASPENLREFLTAMTLNQELTQADWGKMDGVREALERASDNVVRLSQSIEEHALPPTTPTVRIQNKKSWMWTTGVAAAFMAALALWMVNGGQTYRTDIGEQKTVELADRSIVNLNSRSTVKLDFSSTAREVVLEGEAMFKVQHDPARPFRVRSGNAVIQAIGTEFNVRHLPSGTTVSVIEGAVLVSGNGQETLQAGEEARIDREGRVQKRVIADLVAAATWQRHRLVFRDNTLEDIAAEFNRWNRKQIRIEGNVDVTRRYDGAFDADDADSLIEFLRRTPGLVVEDQGERLLIRRD